MAVEHPTDDQIQQYLDDQAGPAATPIAAHLESCPRCREAVGSYRRLYHELADETEFVLPADFAAKVIAQIQPQPKPWFRFAETLAIAASLAVVCAAGYLFADFSAMWITLKSTLTPLSEMGINIQSAVGGLLNGLNIKTNLAVSAGLILLCFMLLDNLTARLRGGKTLFFA